MVDMQLSLLRLETAINRTTNSDSEDSVNPEEVTVDQVAGLITLIFALAYLGIIVCRSPPPSKQCCLQLSTSLCMGMVRYFQRRSSSQVHRSAPQVGDIESASDHSQNQRDAPENSSVRPSLQTRTLIHRQNRTRFANVRRFRSLDSPAFFPNSATQQHTFETLAEIHHAPPEKNLLDFSLSPSKVGGDQPAPNPSTSSSSSSHNVQTTQV